MQIYKDKSRMDVEGRFSTVRGVEKDLFISTETEWLM
jgi:hypothetical protein